MFPENFMGGTDSSTPNPYESSANLTLDLAIGEEFALTVKTTQGLAHFGQLAITDVVMGPNDVATATILIHNQPRVVTMGDKIHVYTQANELNPGDLSITFGEVTAIDLNTSKVSLSLLIPAEVVPLTPGIVY